MRAVEYRTIATYGFIAIIPPIILGGLIQKYIVRGLTFGAVEGYRSIGTRLHAYI